MNHDSLPVTREEREHARREALYRQAKFEFGVSLIARAAIVLLIPFLLQNTTYTPVALLAGLLVAEFFSYRSDSTKGLAEQVARAIDYHDSLGWPLKEKQRLNAASGVSERLLNKVVSEHRAKNRRYFDTPVEVGPNRAAENVKQSAWYTGEQARGMQALMWWMVLLTLLAAAGYFVYTTAQSVSVGGNEGLQNYAGALKTTIALITAANSLGLVKLAMGYGKAAQAAQRHYDLAEEYAKRGSALLEKDAVFLLASYHTARGSMPLIPQWWWNRQEKTLNRRWRQEVLDRT
ncbi:hypothetical protein [Deinococcus humi]|uniref:DUF4231 domain-containing protein n=1 Tax=Deinococcus humi TaxID=662880 RepID=A0A7W8JXT1_9DEIO|nr:hypothetical protein [Deinococcus humi]MBB5364838.1 hypothetical protein [Deinococcus humi]